MSPQAAFVIEKVLSLSLVALAVFFLSPPALLMTFIVLGQGHFFIAYLYQYRAKKITRSYIGLYALALIPSLATLLWFGRLDLLVFAAGTIFLIHFLQDEVFLAGKKPALLRTLEMTPVFFLYVGFLLDIVLRLPVLPYLAAAAATVLILYAATLVRVRRLPDLLGAYFLALAGLLFYLYLANVNVPLRVLIGALVLLHYSTWYIQYFYKVRSNAERLRTYIRSVLACNLLAVALYALFLTPLGNPWLFVLFSPSFFYIWTMQHILFSIRWNDWKGSFS